jgi:tetratricopeptide (TPR) repeat protein
MSARECALPLTLSLREREETSAIRSVMGRVIGACPTLLIVEDADAMDRASTRLTLDLMEAASRRPLSVVITARAEPWPDWRASHVSRVPLAPLNQAESEEWLRSRLVDIELPSDALEAMVAWAKGAPVLLELAAQRILLRTSSSMRELASALQALEHGDDDELQSTVDGVLRTNPRSVRQWIEFASVVGTRCPIEMISACLPVTSETEDMIRACCSTSLVTERNNQLVFRGEGIRSVVRSLMASEERDQYHRFAAAWFGEVEPQRACPEIVAQHLESSGAIVEAADQYERAAQDLFSRGLARAAASVFARASCLWERVGEIEARNRTALARVESLLRAGDGKLAAEEALRIESEPHSLDGLRARAVALSAVTEGNPDLACKALLRASEAAVDALDQLSWYYVESELTDLLRDNKRFADAETHAALAHELAMSLAEGARPGDREATERLSHAATSLAKVRAALARPVEGRTVLMRCLDYVSSRGDEASASRVLANLAHFFSTAGEPRTALDYAERSLALARRAGDRMAAGRVAINVGTYRSKLGDRVGAIEAFTLAKTLSQSIGWARGAKMAKDAVAQLG